MYMHKNANVWVCGCISIILPKVFVKFQDEFYHLIEGQVSQYQIAGGYFYR